MTIYWGRAIGGAFLLELVLFAVLVPIGSINQTLFLVAVPIGTLVFGYLVTFGVLRNARSDVWVNGALLGFFATAIYFGIVIVSAGISAAIATYGLALFAFANVMRLAGCLMAALHLSRREIALTSPARN
jgi:hypothetical protein